MFLIIWLLLPLFIFPILLKIKAPYGRHSHTRFGFCLPYRLGWILMEAPALISFLFFYFQTAPSKISYVFLALWSLHYVYRSFIYPYKASGKPISWLIVLSSFLFNSINGYLNGFYLAQFDYPIHWLYDPRFISGVLFFFAGAYINFQSDQILIHLKKRSHHYQIPYGGLFRYISSPNYLGEIIEWMGFALMMWSLPALAFFLWTIANLVPRAIHHHRWYQNRFIDYPKNRKILFPFLW